MHQSRDESQVPGVRVKFYDKDINILDPSCGSSGFTARAPVTPHKGPLRVTPY